jgi:hypothetical protein
VDDELLRALARHHRRAHAESDPGMPPTSDVHADTDELSRPLSAEERDSVLDAVFDAVDSKEREAEPMPVVLEERRSSRGRMWAVAGVVVAIAAALVLWIAGPRIEPGAALPTYSITSLKGGVSAVRSDPTAVDRELVLEPSSEIDVVVTPARAVSGPLAVTMIAEAPDHRPRMVELEGAEISASGAVRLRGPLSRFIALDPGAWQLWVVVTPADRPPTDVEEALADETYARAGFRVKLTSGP